MRNIPFLSNLRSRVSRGLDNKIRSRIAPLSFYQYGKIGFWAAVAVIVISSIGVTLGKIGFSIDALAILVQNPSSGFFGSSLNLILSIISLVFVVVIFLVQNANQEYSSRLSGVILHDKYFLRTIGFILAASIFNISLCLNSERGFLTSQ